MKISSRNHSQETEVKMDILMYNRDILNVTEIIENRLFFAVAHSDVSLKNTQDTLFFNTDSEFIYMNYYFDFGPLNLSCVYKYCRKVNEYLKNSKSRRIVHVTTDDPQSKANAAFLIGSYVIIYLHISPKDITKALISGCGSFMPFVDASQGGSDWKISLLDCFAAMYKAFHLKFFDFNDFDANEYDTYEKLSNGDLNWLLPNKFLAFIGPTDMNYMNFHNPEFYIQYFAKNNVKAVVRLNNVMYNATVFSSVGIEHYDLYFPDGTTPPKKILLNFLHIAERTDGALAVHCKAGLGRTGSLIGAFIIKHYRFTAREVIAWLRICRPGSVIGQQQGWLEHMENWLWRQGNYYRYEVYGDFDKIRRHKFGIYSLQWKKEQSEYVKKQKENERSVQSRVSKSMKQIDKPRTDISTGSIKHAKCGSSKSNTCKLIHDSNSNVSSVMYNINNRQQQTYNSGNTQGDKLNFIKMNKRGVQVKKNNFSTNLNISFPRRKH